MDAFEPNVTVGELGEDALLARLLADLPTGQDLVVGPGDDCAVVSRPNSDTDLLLKTDGIVEGVHYESSEDPIRVGAKALKRALSDIAAMGGSPCHALVTIAFPADAKASYIQGLYQGLSNVATEFQVGLAGGETIGLPPGSPALISISLTGEVPAGAAILRSDAQVGDTVLVTGQLGGSLTSGWHLDFHPRLAEGQWLREHNAATSMMDLSDGLGTDLPRLAKLSGVGYQVDPELLPCRPGCTQEQALSDGEDYELLFTSPTSGVDDLLKNWPFDTPVTAIGKIVDPAEGQLLGASGWEHFRSS